ncbi:MAG: hypothetical protein ACON4Z_10250 [Planctomycetota bacterium]
MGALSLAISALAPLWSWTSDGEPLRLGLRVPRDVLVRGLSLAGGGAMQWRLLPLGPGAPPGTETAAAPLEDEVWIEVGICAPRGRVRLMVGGAAPTPRGAGPAFVLRMEARRGAEGVTSLARWEWVDGSVDERVRTVFSTASAVGGEHYQAGEARTLQSPGLDRRARWWRERGRVEAARCGLLPVGRRPGRSRGAAALVRRRLNEAVAALVELPGQRGAGDYARRDGEVTNLEYDTTFALLRCAVASRNRRAFVLAQRGARHLRDRDLDARTGLPFLHGATHRSGRVESGHAWLQGMLWIGLLTADDGALAAARALGRALAAHLPVGRRRQERLRSYAWPLLEAEALLRVAHDPVVARAADRLAVAIAARFDARARTWRFGEGEEPRGVYLERSWLTAGLLIPALRSHLRRRADPALRSQVELVARGLVRSIGSGARGLPTHYRLRQGRAFAHHFELGTPRSAWLLEALSARSQRRLLERANLRRASFDLLAADSPDLATEFTLVARCDWVWR